MTNFWDSSVWGFVNLMGVLLISLLISNALKRKVSLVRKSLIPTSVLGGLMLLVIAWIYKTISETALFDTQFFGGNGCEMLEMITYHCLAIGFISMTFKNSNKKLSKERNIEIFNTGVTTVCTYLLQGILGLGITILLVKVCTDIIDAAGILLPFGYGQGTGQAMNYGNIYETDYGFVGGRNFGLTIAALGFLSASFGGIIHLNILRAKGRKFATEEDEVAQVKSMAPNNSFMDSLAIAVAFIFGTYMIAYLIIFALGNLAGGLKSVLYGFNFLIGVLIATLVKKIVNSLREKNVITREIISPYMMEQIEGFTFDLMIVAGIAAIQINLLKGYWYVAVILGAVGLFATYFYNKYVADTLFTEYKDEQFLGMYGMMTGTASTGVILLKEADPNFKTPVAENMVYQNFPAIVFGFPMMLLAALAPKNAILTLGILVAFFVVMNVVLFRSKIFKKKADK